MTKLEALCKSAYDARIKMGMLDTEKNNEVLLKAAELLVANQDTIIEANKIDVQHGKENLMPAGLLDRLTLTS